MLDLSPGWAFAVGWAACAVVMAAWLTRETRRPITEDDLHCAAVDAELDAEEYRRRIAASRTRHPSADR